MKTGNISNWIVYSLCVLNDQINRIKMAKRIKPIWTILELMQFIRVSCKYGLVCRSLQTKTSPICLAFNAGCWLWKNLDLIQLPSTWKLFKFHSVSTRSNAVPPHAVAHSNLPYIQSHSSTFQLQIQLALWNWQFSANNKSEWYLKTKFFINFDSISTILSYQRFAWQKIAKYFRSQ